MCGINKVQTCHCINDTVSREIFQGMVLHHPDAWASCKLPLHCCGLASYLSLALRALQQYCIDRRAYGCANWPESILPDATHLRYSWSMTGSLKEYVSC